MADTIHVPAHIRPYVDALGPEGAEKFFLNFGGAYQYIPVTPQAGNKIVALVGSEKALKLFAALGPGNYSIPIPRRWLALQMAARGMGRMQIARALKVSHVSVAKYIGTGDDRQLPLFGPDAPAA